MNIAQLDFRNLTIPASPAPIDINDAGLTIGKMVSKVLPYVFAISSLLLLLYLLLGGFGLMFAAGDPKKVQGAWAKITNAVIGFVIIFLAYGITKLFGVVFNIQKIIDIFT